MNKISKAASELGKLSHKKRNPKFQRLAGLKNGLRIAILNNKSPEIIRVLHEEIALINQEILKKEINKNE